MPFVLKLLTTLAGLWPIWLPLLVGGLAVYLLLPRPRPYPAYAGALAGAVALLLGGGLLVRSTGMSIEGFLFYAFSALAIIGGALLVTQHNPARAALSFALVILSTCGLFLLLAAPFLFAATIIIYAGAILVTFLFVLMLAQQAGLSDADLRSREPLLATLTGFLLLAAVLYVLQAYPQADKTVDELLARIDRALEQDSREAMRPYVEPSQTEQEKEHDNRQLFKQAANLLKSVGLAKAAEKARHADDEWVLADSIAEETAAQSKVALEKLRAALEPNRERIRERLTAARLPGPDDEEEAGPARKAPLPLSALAGPPPSTPPGEVRRDPRTGRPQLPAENAAYLGRALFTDYLLPVELGGTLLLVATVGAIAIANRRDAERRSRPAPGGGGDGEAGRAV